LLVLLAVTVSAAGVIASLGLLATLKEAL
jgi:hypothetical protein